MVQQSPIIVLSPEQYRALNGPCQLLDAPDLNRNFDLQAGIEVLLLVLVILSKVSTGTGS